MRRKLLIPTYTLIILIPATNVHFPTALPEPLECTSFKPAVCSIGPGYLTGLVNN
jgi:hypothetical protein